MQAKLFRNIGSLYGLILILSACSADTPTQVKLQIVQPSSMASSSLDPIVNSNRTHLIGGEQNGRNVEVSSTGLFMEGACYFVNVTGPGLNITNLSDSQQGTSCAFPAPGLGKVFGPFPYGVEAKMQIPSGASRRFEIVGFVNPYGASDSRCQKPFRTVPQPNGTVDIFYGDYVIDPSPLTLTRLPAGVSVAPFTTDLYVFATNRERPMTLSPGTSVTVQLNAVAWERDDPKAYGCHPILPPGGDGVIGVPGDEEDVGQRPWTFPPHNPSEIPNDDRVYIYTGMEHDAFLEVQCPAGVSELSIRLIGKNRIWTSPPNTANCLGEAAKFGGLPLGDTALADWNNTTGVCMQNQQNCINFEIYKGPTASGDLLLQGQFLRSARYQALLNNNTTGDNRLKIPSAAGLIERFSGYLLNESNQQRTLYVSQNQSSSAMYKIKLLSHTSPPPGALPGAVWDGIPLVNLLMPSTPPALWNWVRGSGFFGIAQFGSAPVTQKFLRGWDNDTNGSFESTYYRPLLATDTPALGLNMVTDNGVTVAASEKGNLLLTGVFDQSLNAFTFTENPMLNDGQYLKVNPIDVNSCPSLMQPPDGLVRVWSIGSAPEFQTVLQTSSGADFQGDHSCEVTFETIPFFAAQTRNTPWVEYDWFKPLPNGFQIPATHKPELLVVDLPLGAGAVQHMVYADKNQDDIVYNRCSDFLDNCKFVRHDLAGERPKAIDIFPGGPLLVLSQGGSGKTLKRFHLGFDSSLEVPTITPASDQALGHFYPPLPTLASDKVILKTLRHADSGISSNSEALMYLRAGPDRYLYRTRDSGKNWFRVHSFGNMQDVVDIHPIHLATGDNSLNKGGFILLIRDSTTNGLYFLIEDGQHGF